MYATSSSIPSGHWGEIKCPTTIAHVRFILIVIDDLFLYLLMLFYYMLWLTLFQFKWPHAIYTQLSAVYELPQPTLKVLEVLHSPVHAL